MTQFWTLRSWIIRVCQVIVLVAIVPHRLAHAELSYLDLKGIDALVDHPGASPVYGYNALKTGFWHRWHRQVAQGGTGTEPI